VPKEQFTKPAEKPKEDRPTRRQSNKVSSSNLAAKKPASKPNPTLSKVHKRQLKAKELEEAIKETKRAQVAIMIILEC